MRGPEKSLPRYSRRGSGPMHEIEKWLSGAVVLTGIIFLLPAGLTFGEHHLKYDKDLKQIIQSRSAYLSAKADWRAGIYELRNSRWVLVCDGGGDGSIYRSGQYTKTMTIDVWVGSAGCASSMIGGETYRASATWTRSFFIWSWTAEATSDPFTWP